MTDSVLERTAHDASSPRVCRPIVRLALRSLVVAGIAGGAWLLSSAAAHAAVGHPAGASDSTAAVTSLVTGLGGDGGGDILPPGATGTPTPTEAPPPVLTPSPATTGVRPPRGTDRVRGP